MTNLDKYGDNEGVEIPALSLVHVLTYDTECAVIPAQCRIKYWWWCGRALVCGYPNWFSGLSSASVQYFGFALGLRCWRKCRVTRTCVNVGTSLVAHARISIQRNVKEESLYMCRRSNWIMHLFILTQQSAHPIHLGYGPAEGHRQSDPLARYIISYKNVSACNR